ncbi:MAG: DUF2029 domain-containing protein [Chloroflexota bacterium]|nr:DUF2029 domain-containing protein [Chloroflexota bacterium]
MAFHRRPARLPWLAVGAILAVNLLRPSRWPPHRRRLAWTAFTMICWGGIVFAWIWLNFNQRDFMQDARAYWRFDYNRLYGLGTVGGRDAYLYSPAFAQLAFPFGALPWPVFKGLWSALNIAALVWLAGPRWGVLLLLFPGSPVSDEISTGNLQLLIAVAAVTGFRYPATWAFTLLTKVTPGIGLLWFVGRRAWRQLAVALGITAAITVVSFAIGPHLWFEWADSLRHNTGVNIPAYAVALDWPLGVRLALAGAVALVGGILNWRWTVLVACALALPVFWLSGLSVLVGIIALLRGRGGRPARAARDVA